MKHYHPATDLQDFISILKSEDEIVEITAPVNPILEVAEIHRRVIEQGGPALLFRNVTSSPFPLVTNLFGTQKRIDLAFGSRPLQLMKEIARLPQEMLPPSFSKIWEKRSLFSSLLKVGLKKEAKSKNLSVAESPAKLGELPLIKSWKDDGGSFVTLPLVYSEDPISKVHNLGMYRLQRYDDSSTGFHCQIAKGGGYHLKHAQELGQKLPVNVTIGGPPALILSAIAPLPENIPELLLSSFLLNKRLKLANNPYNDLPIISSGEFCLVGEVDPLEERDEGPFGDHYGYYSLKHPYPVFRVQAMYRKSHPICAATVVGKPKQEDFFLGDYLQELLSPLFPIVMPTVSDLWSYGETGYHSLSAAVVKQRYKREALVSAFRILGEGQLSLTKFLLITDKACDLKDFRSLLSFILERTDFASDLYIFSNLSFDTLDYTSSKINLGSKALLLGVGEQIRKLPTHFNSKVESNLFQEAQVFCPGCLVIQSDSYKKNKELPELLAKDEIFKDWPLIVLVDDIKQTLKNTSSFLWSVFTRFEPAADIYSHSQTILKNHISYTPPIVIDARFKPWYPEELVCDPETSQLVDKRWKEYGIIDIF
jgi:UbiD family decarboxylase